MFYGLVELPVCGERRQLARASTRLLKTVLLVFFAEKVSANKFANHLLWILRNC